MKDIEQVWQEFWKPIVEKDGVLDLEQVKKELFDFWQAMQSVPKVYCHVTRDAVSKILTDPDVVISIADDLVTRWCEEAVDEYKRDND